MSSGISVYGALQMTDIPAIFKVVDTYAAQMEIPNKTVAFHDANHLEMGQIISDDDTLFDMICGRTRTASGETQHIKYLL